MQPFQRIRGPGTRKSVLEFKVQPEVRGGKGREILFIAFFQLVRTESHGHIQLQGRLGNVVLLSMQPRAQLNGGRGGG